MNKQMKKIIYGMFVFTVFAATLSVQAADSVEGVYEEKILDATAEEIIIDFDDAEQQEEMQFESELSDDTSVDEKNIPEESIISNVEVLAIEEIYASEEISVDAKQIYSSGNLPGNPITNQIEYNQYYTFNTLQEDDDRYHSRYYFEMNFPESGRAKILIEDCASSIMNSEWYHSDYTSLESQEWVVQGTDNYDSGWLTVKGGAFAFAVEHSGKINAEARIMIQYQSNQEYNGELEDNDTYGTATIIKSNIIYEGNCRTQGDIDLYKFSMDSAGLVQIQVHNKDGISSWRLYEEDVNGNVTEVMYYAPTFFTGTPRLRLAQGNYFLEVQPWVRANEREYTVLANVVYESPDLYEQEKNNVRSQANEIQGNCYYTGNLNGKDDVDNFKIIVNENGFLSLEFKVPIQSPKNKITISLCNDNMEILESISNTENPYHNTAEKFYSPGIYYVRVTAGENYSPDKTEFDFYEDYAFNLNYRIVHSWNAGQVIKEATCIQKGEKVYTCTVCSENKVEEIPLAGHSWGAWNQTVAPTVKAEGMEKRECSVCHKAEERTVEKLPLKLATVKLNKLTVSSGDHMKVSWKKVDGADGYLVYRRNNGKWQQIAKVKGNNLTYTDKTTKIGTKYTYTVKAYTDLEDETVYGGYNKTGVTLTQTYYKSSVKLTSAKATSTKAIQIKWKTRSKADGYIIYRKTPGSKWKKIATVGKKSSYTDKKCKSATTYLYTVKAYTKVNGKTIYSNYDNSGIVATTKMLKPTIKVSSKTKKKATISWSKQSNVSGYAIYRKKAGGKWSKIKTLNFKKSSYVDKNLKSGKTYYYAVKAYIKANPKVGIDEPIYSAYNTKKVKIK